MKVQGAGLSYKFNAVAKLFLGLGLASGLPPISFFGLAAVCLSVLLWLELQNHHQNKRTHFVSGLSFGFGYFIVAFHWIGYAFLVDAEAYLWMMPFAVGGLALFMASYWGVAFVLAHALAKRGFVLWLALPCALAVIELIRGYLFTGFPWAAPGLVADGMGGVLQLASLIGMPGLTLMILLWGMVPAVILAQRRSGLKKLLVPVLIITALPVAWLWGEARLKNAPSTAENAPMIRVVQPNISQSDKWRAENANSIFEDLLNLTSAPADVVPDVVIWPESAVSFLLDESEDAKRQIGATLQVNQTLLTGAIRRQVIDQSENYFTSILMFNDGGAVAGTYDKWRLVPGGEYLPLAWALEPFGFRKVVSLPESFTAGPGPQGLNIPNVGFAGLLICYEAIFPHQFVPAQRPRWMVNVTNDGWFDGSVGPHQHFAQVRMRAVEQGLPIARSANTGISAVVDSFGRVSGLLALRTQNFVDVQLPQALEPTVFTIWGNLPLFLLLFLLTAIARFLGRQKSDPQKL